MRNEDEKFALRRQRPAPSSGADIERVIVEADRRPAINPFREVRRRKRGLEIDRLVDHNERRLG